MAHTTALTQPQGHVFLNPSPYPRGKCTSCGRVDVEREGQLCNQNDADFCCAEISAVYMARRLGIHWPNK